MNIIRNKNPSFKRSTCIWISEINVSSSLKRIESIRVYEVARRIWQWGSKNINGGSCTDQTKHPGKFYTLGKYIFKHNKTLCQLQSTHGNPFRLHAIKWLNVNPRIQMYTIEDFPNVTNATNDVHFLLLENWIDWAILDLCFS